MVFCIAGGCARLFGGGGGSDEELGRAEHDGAARLDEHLLSSLGIASTPFPLLADHERSEPGDLDLLAVAEMTFYRLEDDLDQTRRFAVGDAAMTLVHNPGDIGLRHGPRAPSE